MSALGKTMIDALYHIPFRDFYKVFWDKNDTFLPDDQSLSRKLNGDLVNLPGVRSNNLVELFNEEFQGDIEASSDIINSAMAVFMKWHYNNERIDLNEIQNRGFINMFSNLFRFDKIGNHFPSLQVHSGLHASVRYDKSKKFQPNDLFDFRHAACAIPYCQYFITDNPLSQRLMNKPLCFGTKFGTKVLPADPELILQTLEGLLN